MGNRNVDQGYILLDSIFTVFLATVLLVTFLSMLTLVVRRTAAVVARVAEYVEMTNEDASGRPVVFLRNE